MITTLIAFSALALPAPVNFALVAQEPFVLTAEYKKQTIDALCQQLSERYVLIDIAKKIEADLKKRSTAGEFETIATGAEFSSKLNKILSGLVTDAHLNFRFSEQGFPKRENPMEPSPAEIERAREETRFVNSNFERVERLRGNVGYFKFDGFESPEDVKRPMAAVMNFLANCDAMIIDLRNNGGGHPSGVQVVCSYFFPEKPVLLNTIFFRQGNSGTTREFWTLEKLDAPRFLNKDVFILTSKRTGSGAEECAYNLQQLKRATIVGSSTWGGANPGGMVRLNDHFACFIPVGRAINPYSKTNWEGAGVQPDVKIAPEEALKNAQLLAIKNMIAKTTDADKKADLQQIYDSVAAGK